MSSRYGDLIKKARKPENQRPDSSPQTELNPDVNLSVKVPLAWRRHWAAEAKRQGVTLTSVIVDALKTRFGEPG